MKHTQTVQAGAPGTQSIELYNHIGRKIQDCVDLDEARIYAMKRPALRFFVEMWDKWDANGNRELLHSECLN